DVNGQLATRHNRGGDTCKGRRRIRRVMQDADGVGEIERALTKWQREDVGLRQMDVAEMADVLVGRINGRGQVYAKDFGPLGRGALSQTAGAEAGVEQAFSLVVVVLPACARRQGLFGLGSLVLRVDLHLSKPVPLMSEALRVRSGRHEARHPARDRIDLRAAGAGQAAIENLGSFT